MAAQYPCRIWRHSGFDPGNVPDRPSLLEGLDDFVDVPAVYKRQSQGLAEVRVAGTWNGLRNADYCRIGAIGGSDTAYYWITGITAENDGTILLSLAMDPLTTGGGLNHISVVGGWCKRKCPTSDGLFENNLPEPWVPQARMYTIDKQIIPGGDQTTPTTKIVLATCDVSEGVFYKAITIAAYKSVDGDTESEGGSTVTMPELPNPGKQFYQHVIDGTSPELPSREGAISGSTFALPNRGSMTIPSVYAYDGDLPSVQYGIPAIRSIGVEGAIVNSYQIPSDLVQIKTKGRKVDAIDQTKEPVLLLIWGIREDVASESPYVSRGTKNKKAEYLWNFYRITSMTSGNSADYDAKDIFNNDTAPVFQRFSDPGPNGTLYAQPKYQGGSESYLFEGAVAGMPWNNASIVYETASGAAIASLNAGRTVRDLKTQKAKQTADLLNIPGKLVGGVVGGMKVGGTIGMSVGSFPGFLAGAVGGAAVGGIGAGVSAYKTAKDYEQTERDIRRAELQQSYELNVYPPEVAFPVTTGAVGYIGNQFLVEHIVLSDADVQRFDDFLTMYGYASDEKFTKTALTSHQNFNFIQTSEAFIQCDDLARTYENEITQLFNEGVRIWHTLPSQSRLLNNPIAGGG